MARAAVFAIAVLAAALATPPASAQVNWAGPYLGPIAGYAAGTADYVFHTDGQYNNAPGDTFEHGVAGFPMGAVLGYNWQNGHIVYGFEASIYAALRGVSAYDVPIPVGPAGQTASLKGHWFAAVAPRIGIARGPALFYVQAGPAFGHLIWTLADSGAGIHLVDNSSAFGITAGFGIELMDPGRRYSIDIGYQYLGLRPMRLTYAESVSNPGGVPAGPGTGTDHTLTYRTHALTMSINYFGSPAAAGQGNLPALTDWAGPYLSVATGPPLREFGGGVGYNFVRGRLLIGTEAFALAALCCGFDFEAMANARAGIILSDNVVAYAEAGLSYIWGSLWGGYYSGLLHNMGVGLEVALNPRVAGFMELKLVGNFGALPNLANWVGGLNFQLGR